MNKILQKLFVFFSVFCYQISQVFISNFLFVFHFIIQISKNGKIVYNSGRLSRSLLFVFLGYIFLNTVVYSFLYIPLDIRGVVQLVYNFQYLFLVIYINFDYQLIEKIIFRTVILLSHILVIHFIISGDSLELYKWNEFSNTYFPGWTNTLPLYLILALFFNRKIKYSLYYNFVIIGAVVLTGSRGALLAVIGVLLLPVFRKYQKYMNVLLITCLSLLIIFFNLLLNLENDLKFFRAFDRVDIFYTSYAYIKQSFLFGYGGNTLDQLTHIKIDYEPLMVWGHTHNFVLEFLLRYGLIGLLLFVFFLFYKIKEIIDFEYRFLFFLFIVLAFFQTFMRDFIFLSILILISHYQFFNKEGK